MIKSISMAIWTVPKNRNFRIKTEPVTFGAYAIVQCTYVWCRNIALHPHSRSRCNGTLYVWCLGQTFAIASA